MTGQLPPHLREFDDVDATRKAIYDNALDALTKKFPIEDDKFRLELVKPYYKGPQEFSLAQQKKALIQDRQLRTPIVGTWRLLDKTTGDVLDEREDTVMHVPYYTPRGTFIHRGNEYSIINQARLKPGAYIRKKKTGEIETHVNVEPGSGVGFRIYLEPSTGIFKLQMGQSLVPIYPLLKAVGVSNEQMSEYWGKELAERNINDDPKALNRIYTRLAGFRLLPNASEVDQINFLRNELPKFKLNPEVISHTLGLPDTSGITPNVILRATQKMLNVARGTEDSDDRDAPQYSDYYAVEDFIRERIEKDAGKTARSLLFKLRRSKNLANVQRGVLNPYIESLIVGSGLAQPLEETNPLHILEQMTRVIKTGEGGIGSVEAITDEARNVNPGQFGFIDPVHGPERMAVGIDVRTAYGTYKGKDKQIYAEFKNPATGKVEYLNPAQASTKIIAFPGQLDDPDNKRVVAMIRGKLGRVKRNQVDYEVPSLGHMMSAQSNLNLMPTGFQPGRLFYATKFWSQYMPQVRGEVPMVDSLMPDGETTFSEYYGRKVGTVPSKVGGQVLKITDDAITVLDGKGEKHNYEIVKDFAFNRMSVSGDTLIFVKNSNQIIRIEIKDYVYRDGDTVLSYDPATKKSSWQKVNAFIKHGAIDKKLFRVKFKSGRSITVTEDHSLLTLDNNFELIPVYPLDCIIGVTRCPVVFGTDILENDSMWSYDDGVLDGLYLSEGNLSKQPGQCKIAVQPQDRKDYVKSLVEKAGHVPHNSKDGACVWTDHERYARWEADFGKYASGKYIAPHVYSRGLSYLSGLIAGYMGGDGCLWSDSNRAIQVCASSCSKKLRDGLVSVLHLFGIFATISGPKYNGPGWGDLYSFRVRSSDLHRLQRWFCYADRQAKFESAVSDSYRSTDFDCIPATKSQHKFIYNSFDGNVPFDVYRAAYNNKISKHKITTCTGNVGLWARSDILWDTIVGIDAVPSEEYVYDFSVDTSQAFADAHGLLVHNTGVSYTPVVKVGDKVKPGQMLASSNFTDPKTGSLTLGVNLKAVMIPARGQSYEDAYTISETAAKRLTNQRIYGFDQEARHGTEINRNRYISLFPQTFTKDQVANIDDDGLVKPGTVVHKGDPLILATGPKLLSSTEAQLGNLHKVLRNAFTDKAVIWEYEHPGIVTDVGNTPSGAKVNVKSEAPVRMGDKLSTRFGLKGVVGRVIPDDEMPRDPVTNEPYEVMLNPMGVLSRIAPAQLVELALAKIAKKTGKQIRVPQLPPKEGWANWAKKQLDENGIDPEAIVFDPISGKNIGKVGDGYVYVSAFHHLAEKKLSARGGMGSGGYTVDMQPARGGHTGSKKFSQQDLFAALAHGANEVIKDVITIRGNKDEDFWKALKLGRPLPAPKVPFIYDKFLGLLKAGGININDQGDILSLLPMTDDAVASMSKGEIKISDMVNSGFEPMKDGLFDVGTTGGMSGNRWSHISLVEPMPNPVMEEPIRRLLGMTRNDLMDVLGGKQSINGATGGVAIQNALKALDIDELIKEHKNKVKTLRGTNRDNSIKILGYLSAAKEQGIHPSGWMITKVPVLPPIFRPVSKMGDVALVADINELYRDVIEVNNNLRDLRDQVGDTGTGTEKRLLYDAITAAYGLGESTTVEGKSKRLKGAVRQIIGDSPKFGLFQSKVISKPVDVVGRGVVTPDPNLDMDSVGIPEESAWVLYKDFVMRRLVQRGFPPLRALELIENRTPEAKMLLEEEMSERPVIMNRAPTWHKFNLLAFHPHIAEGSTIRVSPLITRGFTMDFDGDQANFHVPISDKAVEQANEKMLPSKNLFSLTDLKSIRHAPTQELALGVYMMTREPSTKLPIRFKTAAEAKAAYAAGKIQLNDPIVIG